MNHKVVRCLIAGALSTILAFASPALAQRGGGGGGFGSGAGGGGHAGGMGGGMGGGGHVGGFGSGAGGGMHAGGSPAGGHFGGMSGGMRFGGSSGGTHFSGGRFAGAQFARPGFSSRSSSFAFRDRHGSFHHRPFFHHRFHRFAFVGAPFAYAGYDSCWRRVWTPYGWRRVNVCSDYYGS